MNRGSEEAQVKEFLSYRAFLNFFVVLAMNEYKGEVFFITVFHELHLAVSADISWLWDSKNLDYKASVHVKNVDTERLKS